MAAPDPLPQPPPRSVPPPDDPDRPRRLPWAELLRRTFGTDVLECAKCGGWCDVVGVVTYPPRAQEILEELGIDAPEPHLACARLAPKQDDFDLPSAEQRAVARSLSERGLLIATKDSADEILGTIILLARAGELEEPVLEYLVSYVEQGSRYIVEDFSHPSSRPTAVWLRSHDVRSRWACDGACREPKAFDRNQLVKSRG